MQERRIICFASKELRNKENISSDIIVSLELLMFRVHRNVTKRTCFTFIFIFTVCVGITFSETYTLYKPGWKYCMDMLQRTCCSDTSRCTQQDVLLQHVPAIANVLSLLQCVYELQGAATCPCNKSLRVSALLNLNFQNHSIFLKVC